MNLDRAIEAAAEALLDDAEEYEDPIAEWKASRRDCCNLVAMERQNVGVCQ